jgi:hypothetical protein
VSVPYADPSPPGSHPDAERLALAALPAEPDDPAVAAHLLGCAQCRAEVADLRRVVELARGSGESLAPGGGNSLAPGGGDPLPAPPPQVWRGIAAELGLPAERNGQVGGTVVPPVDGGGADRSANGDGAPPPEPPPLGAPTGTPDRPDDSAAARRPRTTARHRILVPLVTAVLGLAAGLGIGHAVAPGGAPTPAAGPVVRLTPVGDLDPAASGTVAMATAGGERQMVVQVQGVTNIAGGDHLEAWLMDPTGTRLVPLGALAGGGGDFHGTFAVPDGLPFGEFNRVDVSAERWDGNPGHSTLSVLRGDI